MSPSIVPCVYSKRAALTGSLVSFFTSQRFVLCPVFIQTSCGTTHGMACWPQVMLGRGGGDTCVLTFRPGSVRWPALERVGRSGRPEAALRPGPAGAGRPVGAFRRQLFSPRHARQVGGSEQTGSEKRKDRKRGSVGQGLGSYFQLRTPYKVWRRPMRRPNVCKIGC